MSSHGHFLVVTSYRSRTLNRCAHDVQTIDPEASVSVEDLCEIARARLRKMRPADFDWDQALGYIPPVIIVTIIEGVFERTLELFYLS